MRAALLLVTLLGCLDTGTPQAPPEPPAPKLLRAPLPPFPVETTPPAQATVDVSLGDGIQLRRPIKSGRLSLIPIVDRAKPSEAKFITLQDGMTRRQVDVVDIIEIEAVQVTNRANEPLVIMGGELIIDGYQDRMIQHDVVIAPHAAQRVAVWCVERGRFEGEEWFHASNALAEPTLRKAAAFGSQGDVWDRVDEINAREGLAPSTSTYRHAARRQRSPATITRRTELTAQLDSLEERDHVVGHAIAIDGRIVAIDRFATPGLYRQLRDEVLNSYLHVSQGKGAATKELSPADVQSWSKLNATNLIGVTSRSRQSPVAPPPPAALDLQ